MAVDKKMDEKDEMNMNLFDVLKMGERQIVNLILQGREDAKEKEESIRDLVSEVKSRFNLEAGQYKEMAFSVG